MKYIRNQRLTPSEAKKLEALNFKLVHLQTNKDNTDTYRIYLKGE